MIPKVIYMCHKTLKNIKVYSGNWKKLNPDYDIKLYDDTMCREFLLKEYSQLHLDIFDFLEDGPIKSDFWRVCIINKYGGYYVDSDIEPISPLKKYVDDKDDFVTCISMNFKPHYIHFQLNPHLIFSDKNSIILQNCIDRYIQKYSNKDKYDYWSWSVCNLLIIDGITRKFNRIKINDIQFNFLHEKKNKTCTFKNRLVLRNSYSNYKDHNFV